jgi:streptogramin lyase
MHRVLSGSSFGLLCALLLGSSCLFVTGCGMGTTAAPDPVPLTVNGRVHGGQQAVVGAHIQLYVAGNAGNGSQSSALLNTTVTSGTDGSFSITGDYSCPSATSQVYLVATQGNPGLGSGGNNPALAMMAPLGSCGNLTPTQFIWINEVTTVAAAYTLAPFAKDISDIGASATNSRGLANAFLNAQLIANTATGTVATLPSNLTTETGKIYALADAVASCINSDGTTGCAPLFTAAIPSGGSAPTNTWDALMNIVKNPGNNVAGVFSAIGPQPPFATTLTKAPNDWTLSLTVTGGGMLAGGSNNVPPDESPENLGIDSQGNVWTVDRGGMVSGFSPQGTPLSSTGFGSPNAVEAFGLAIDANDNVWVTLAEYAAHSNGTRGSIEKLAGVSSGSSVGTPTIFTDNSLNFPYALAMDSNGTLFIANYAVTGSATNLVAFQPATNTFTAISTGQGLGFPVALAPDTAHGVWITGGDTLSLVHVDAGGNIVFSTDCCGGTDGVAVDSAGMVWLADTQNNSTNSGSGAVTVLASDGTITQDFITGGGITVPSHIAIDAAQNVWISNLHTTVKGEVYESFSELAGSNSSTPGAVISPSTGYGVDAGLLSPYALAVDASGNLWVSDTGAQSLVMFFGMATPTKTPLPVTPLAP